MISCIIVNINAIVLAARNCVLTCFAYSDPRLNSGNNREMLRVWVSHVVPGHWSWTRLPPDASAKSPSESIPTLDRSASPPNLLSWINLLYILTQPSIGALTNEWIMNNIRNRIICEGPLYLFIDASQQSSSKEEFSQRQGQEQVACPENGAQSCSFLHRRQAQIQTRQSCP